MSSNTLHKLDAKRKVHGVMFTWIVGKRGDADSSDVVSP